ncbi:MAG: acyl-CoA dehydrogenase family protein [Gammaproteobacteria bacterium]|nr:acyl-CoA dehydrogenase family protein [Gammaproteobacteria bacterium]
MDEHYARRTRPDAPPFNWPAAPHTTPDALGAEAPPSTLEAEMRRTVHQFAARVMRPIGVALDGLTAAEVIAPGSPYFDYRSELMKLGLTPRAFLELTAEERGRLFPVIMEEFGWGDAGLSIVYGASCLPPLMALVFRRRFLIERFPETLRGCWAITEPDHGSDTLDPGAEAFHAAGRYGRPNCIARLDGDRVIIDGQKSAWVSNAPLAEVCVLYCAADTGNGPDARHGVCVLVPLDAPGVSRGKPLEKMGQRPLPQGELFFDHVELSADYVVAGPEDYQRALHFIHCEANSQMACIFTGVARAAYELAHAYAHQRRQGGVPLVRHQRVATRLFHMYRKIEASRALAKRVAYFNNTAAVPSLPAAMSAKITGTQTAFEVASEALQIFGGNGLTREYPVEKIFRDARAALIEDGCNELLAIKGGMGLIDPELL